MNSFFFFFWVKKKKKNSNFYHTSYIKAKINKQKLFTREVKGRDL